MEERIVYLLGAGASANKLPVVEGFTKYFDYTRGKLMQYILHNDPAQEFKAGEDLKLKNAISNDNYSRQVELFYNLLNRFQGETAEHFSIDTLAKKFYFQGHPDQVYIKQIISAIILEHQVGMGLDPRYEAFLASILQVHQRSILFPYNLDVYSWNYDLQFEEAVYRINRDLYKKSFAQFFSEDDSPSAKYFGFYYRKLNGIAGRHFLYDDRNQSINLSEIEAWRKVVRRNEPKSYALNHFSKILGSGATEINFAWEKDINLLKRQFINLKYAKTLVVIGYSFPNFNSQIDELFFEMGNFEKIFVQCGKNGEEVKERIYSMWEKYRYQFGRVAKEPEIVPLSGVNEFYIPKSFSFNYSTNY